MLMQHWQKVNNWIHVNKSDLFIAGIIFLTGIASFGLGRLSVLMPKKEPLKIEKVETSDKRGVPASAANQEASIVKGGAIQGQYVASKSGTAYHLPWCPGATKIKESNKIWFQTKQEAENRGYKPAANCPGL